MSASPTIHPDSLVQLLGAWTDARGVLKRRLTDALRAAIESGALASGTRLPAERSLAVALGISRGTVVAAYASLREDGLVMSRQGSGTFVPMRADASLEREEARPPSRRSAVFRHLLEAPSDTIELLGSHLPACAQLNAELLAGCGAELEAIARQPGYPPPGPPAPRRAIAAPLTKGGL